MAAIARQVRRHQQPAPVLCALLSGGETSVTACGSGRGARHVQPRAAGLGLDPRHHLDDNDAHTFFAQLDAQFVTGPTLTNVNDFRAVLVR